VICIGLLVGFDPVGLTAEITAALIDWAMTTNPDRPVTAADVQPLVSLNVALLPATVGILGVGMVVLDLVLGAKAVGASDRLKRAPEPLWTVALPGAVPVAFLGATALAFVPGAPGYAAEALAGSFGAALALQGMAVVHTFTRGLAWRTPILSAMYALLVLSGLPVILFVLVGLAESALHLRARRFTPRGPNPN
jgi:hypothetical protein